MLPNPAAPAPPPARRPPHGAGRRKLSAAAAGLALAWGLASITPAVQAAGCADAVEPAAPAPAPAPTAGQARNARQALAALADRASQRNTGLAATRLLAEAAQDDLREIQASRALQAALTAGGGPAATQAEGHTLSSASQLRASVGVSQLLFDGGRTQALIELRRQQGEAARQGLLNQQEQIALATVSAAFELSRARQTAQVYADYRRSAACLVDALQQVVAADRGRFSELVQARKSLAQVELTLTQIEGQVRQSQLRLQRFIGPVGEGAAVPPVEDHTLDGALLDRPALPQLLADAERAAEIRQLDYATRAAEALTESIAAAAKPSLSWSASLGRSSALGGNLPTSHANSASVGINLNIPLLSPGTEPATAAARRRAQASQLQRDDALESRRSRLADLHDQAGSAFERARQTEAIVRDSERLRSFTLQQWQQLGRRSLFDVMAAEADHFGLRVAQVNALHDGQQINATLLSLGSGLLESLARSPAHAAASPPSAAPAQN